MHDGEMPERQILRGESTLWRGARSHQLCRVREVYSTVHDVRHSAAQRKDVYSCALVVVIFFLFELNHHRSSSHLSGARPAETPEGSGREVPFAPPGRYPVSWTAPCEVDRA